MTGSLNAKRRKVDADMHYERTEGTTRYLLFPERLTLHVIVDNRIKDVKDVSEDELYALLESNEWVLK